VSTQPILVPDIGDFADVPVIEVLVKPGDRIAKEDPIATLESDKATLEIPSPFAGVVAAVSVKVGDKVKEGTPLATVEVEAAPTQSPTPATAATPAKASAPAPSPAPAQSPASARAMPSAQAGPAPSPAEQERAAVRGAPAGERAPGTDFDCDVLVLGAGPGGYSAAFRAADLGLKTVLVERYASLGGVCLNVGCIPSKALLHVAAVTDEARALAAHGVDFGAPTFDLAKLRGWRDKVVGKLTGGLAGMAKMRNVRVVRGVGRFVDPHTLEVDATSGDGMATTGAKSTLRFAQAIVAAGSQAVRLPFAPQDPRIVDSTGALALASIPKRMLIVGGGIIGLEMGSVYSTLGTRLDVVEMLDGLMPGADRDLVRVWEKMNKSRFDRIMLKTKTTALDARKDAVYATFEGEGVPKDPQPYDLVLLAVGRAPNGRAIGAEAVGIGVDARGFIDVDAQMRTNVPHIFAIGDIVGQPMLAHKATHEGHVAAEAAAGMKSFFDARVIPSVAYTDPEIAWVGVGEDEAKGKGVAVEKAVFPWAASGRAIANGRDEGFTKLLFDKETHRIVGGGIVGAHAGDLISEIALAIEMGADAVDIGRTIHPHPTLSESIGLAAEVAEGACTDLPPTRRKA